MSTWGGNEPQYRTRTGRQQDPCPAGCPADLVPRTGHWVCPVCGHIVTCCEGEPRQPVT